jgi:hypothetical protein
MFDCALPSVPQTGKAMVGHRHPPTASMNTWKNDNYLHGTKIRFQLKAQLKLF